MYCEQGISVQYPCCMEHAHLFSHIYLKMLSVDQVCVAANDRMMVNNELERM